MNPASNSVARVSRRFYLRLFALRTLARKTSLLLFILFALVALSLLAFVPARSAYAAKPYTVEEFSSVVNVNSDASVDVTSRQLFVFESENQGIVWCLGVPEEYESYKIVDVRFAPVGEDGALLADWTYLQPVDVDIQKQGRMPGDTAAAELRQNQQQPWYSYEAEDGFMRCWFPAEPGTYVFETHYIVNDCVAVYRDVADLVWRYAYEESAGGVNNITCQIKLPMPTAINMSASTALRAWGHGPKDGGFDVQEDGSILYHVDYLMQGSYAEAHVMFPAFWMNSMGEDSPRLFTETRRGEIIEEESDWVDIYSRQRGWDFQVRVLFMSIAAALLLIAVIGVARFGQTNRSQKLLLRLAVIMLCVGLTVTLVFFEPMTEMLLFGIAAILGVLAFFFPSENAFEDSEDNVNNQEDLQ